METAECANCGDDGAFGGLMRCGRCRNEWFCGASCQKAYWPFHRESCRKNEFADAAESQDPKLAGWMRKHGRLAVLKDAEVERLERAGRAASGSISRAECLESMYGRIDPKPRAPTYSTEESLAVEMREREEKRQARMMSSQAKTWAEFRVPEGLGMDCPRYKWRQNQAGEKSHVEVFCLVPPGIHPKKVLVVFDGKGERLAVCLGAAEPPDQLSWHLRGLLCRPIVPASSSWFVADGVLQIRLLKAQRKGRYLPGTCNADTWWRSLMAGAGILETLALQHPPTSYYWGDYEEDDLTPATQIKQDGHRSQRLLVAV